MLAKHLSDLRDLDFPGVAGKDLTRDQLLVVATRYQRGSGLSINKIRENLKAGNSYLSNWKNVKNILQN
jgi:hypothetical protein